jgi:hypothetical protein
VRFSSRYIRRLINSPYPTRFPSTRLEFSSCQVNNTLAPYQTCPNDSNPAIGDRGMYYVKQWVGVYLPKAHARIQALLEGVRLSLEDVYAMQMMCAYEVRTKLRFPSQC